MEQIKEKTPLDNLVEKEGYSIVTEDMHHMGIKPDMNLVLLHKGGKIYEYDPNFKGLARIRGIFQHSKTTSGYKYFVLDITKIEHGNVYCESNISDDGDYEMIKDAVLTQTITGEGNIHAGNNPDDVDDYLSIDSQVIPVING